MTDEAGPSGQEVNDDDSSADSQVQPTANGPAKEDWDPTSTKTTTATVTPRCLVRVKRDMMSMYSDPPPGIFAVSDSEDMTTIHALIIGPFDTPYEGGLFYFLINCPPEYPIKPPRARFMTTDGGKVRFNPNLYKNGKICLSILGTWSGPEWSPAQSLSSVLISIQSILNEKPYHNEPSYEKDPFFDARGQYQYGNIIQRLEALHPKITARCARYKETKEMETSEKEN